MSHIEHTGSGDIATPVAPDVSFLEKHRRVDTRTAPFHNQELRCFVNASLQALFASTSVRAVCAEPQASPQRSGLGAGDPNDDARVSAVYKAAVAGHHTQPSCASEVLAKHYSRAQEDAQEFAQRITNEDDAPALHSLLRGCYKPYLRCHRRA